MRRMTIAYLETLNLWAYADLELRALTEKVFFQKSNSFVCLVSSSTDWQTLSSGTHVPDEIC